MLELGPEPWLDMIALLELADDHCYDVAHVTLQGAQASVPLAGQAGLLRKAEADAHRKVAIQVWQRKK